MTDFHLRRGLRCTAALTPAPRRDRESLHSEQNDTSTHPWPIVKRKDTGGKKCINVQTLKGFNKLLSGRLDV